MNIPEEAVEAAHNAIIGGTEESGPGFGFDTLTRKQVEVVLEAAAPYMLAEWESRRKQGALEMLERDYPEQN